MKRISMTALLAGSIATVATAQDPVWDGNSVVLESQQLADGVFAVIPTGAVNLAADGYPMATTGGFVIGKTGVLVVESMLNERLNGQLFDLIAAQTDLPVRYLVNTSFHGDHTYGNQYLPDDVVIMQHANTAAYLPAAPKTTQRKPLPRPVQDVRATCLGVVDLWPPPDAGKTAPHLLKRQHLQVFVPNPG